MWEKTNDALESVLENIWYVNFMGLCGFLVLIHVLHEGLNGDMDYITLIVAIYFMLSAMWNFIKRRKKKGGK
jgi:hypothetical protein